MPLYEYQCSVCRTRFEKIQKFSDPPEMDCPECGGRSGRLLSAPAIQFKGTGWYLTDYARKGASGGSESGSAGGRAEKESKDSSAADSAPAKPAASPKATD